MPTLVEQALAETRAGHDEKAHQLLAEAVRKRERADVAWAWIAHAAAENDDWRAALQACDRAIAAGDPPWWTYHVRGVALTRLGRAAEAILPLQRAASAAPDSLDVAIAQARCGIAARDFPLAERAVGNATRIDAHDVRTRRVTALLALAQGRAADAATTLRSLLHTDEIDVEALNNLGAALAAAGTEIEARPFFRKAMVHGEVTPYHRVTRGNHLRLERRFPSARPMQPVRRRSLAAMQFTILRWALIALLASEVVFAFRAAGALTVLLFAGAFWLWRRRRPAPRYLVLPPYAGVSITVPRGTSAPRDE